ncbi:hypothetical protein [Actibacterium sp. 188UL27-1]|uniref:hypothetical protein n=1 Tax=Actibacterium sp. 188UL27-1 TaxID=2786961 RepID=UPI001957C419|nr:hypothetical protein [Actibacterium sp. 188UL27-1]MBM7067783.1 hypothetical protein [Actibacterium sp. 188UL27-1]
MRRELDWFNDNLDEPNRLWLRPNRKGEQAGICWFRPTAREHIARAHYMAWLLQEMDVPIQTLRLREPGPLLWEDEHQVVAIVPRDLPRVHH